LSFDLVANEPLKLPDLVWVEHPAYPPVWPSIGGGSPGQGGSMA